MCHASAPTNLLPAPFLGDQPYWTASQGGAPATRRPWQAVPEVAARPIAGWRLAASLARLVLGSVAAAAVVWLMLAGPGFMAHDAHAPRAARLAAR